MSFGTKREVRAGGVCHTHSLGNAKTLSVEIKASGIEFGRADVHYGRAECDAGFVFRWRAICRSGPGVCAGAGIGRAGRGHFGYWRGIDQAGSQRISEGEELRRLIPVLKRLKDKLTIPISVDTYKSGVADKALEHGAEIINDPRDPADLNLPKIVTKYDAGLIVNHMRGNPETWAKLPPVKDLMRTIAIDLDAALNRARLGGVTQAADCD